MSTTTLPLPVTHELRSSSPTIVPEAEEPIVASPVSNRRRWILLALFCVAQFVDVYSASGVVLAIPAISQRIHLTIPQSIWVISAYACSFAALMLPAGRLADIWSAKWVFSIGLVWVGAFALGLAFVDTPNGLIVLRALQGCGAAATIPAATNLIVHLFPEPKLQEIAISIFGATGAIANILGLVLGGVLLLANYRWIFYLITIITIPLAIAAIIFTPETAHAQVAPVSDVEKAGSSIAPDAAPARKPKMDYLGTLVMTAAIVLFVYGLTQANVVGWKSASTLSTMIIGFFLFPLFYYVETLPENEMDALIPPSMWRIRNFALLSGLALTPAFWFFSVQSALSERMQILGATPLLVAARFMPMGVSAILAVGLTQAIPLSKFPIRFRLLAGGLLAAVAALMISFADERVMYWKLLFPAFVLGPMGVATLFITLNVAIIMSVGPERSGVAGGVINSLFQLGVTVGLAITTTLQNAYRDPSSGHLLWKGYRYSFLFVMAVFILVGLLGGALFVNPLPEEEISSLVAAHKEEMSAEEKLERQALA